MSLSPEELEAAQCWEAGDRVPRRPEMSEYRRRIRLHQARWREAHGHPIGTQPLVPKKGNASRLVGSRLPLDYARETGANFVNARAFEAAKKRLASKEPQQSVDAQRIWAELLWSPTMAFNLFGDLAADLALADRAVHTWWPDARGTVCEVRFQHSPGWLDLAYTGTLVGFDAAFVLDVGDGTRGIVGVATKYYDWMKPEVAKPARLARYREIAETSRAFAPDALGAFEEQTGLLVTWLGHLLVLSMLQHPSGAWSWGRYVVVYPAANTDFRAGCAAYRDLLVDDSTFACMTVEDLLDAGPLSRKTAAALRERYLPG